MSQLTDYEVFERVMVRYRGRDTEGWIRGKTFTAPPVYDVQIDGELLKSLIADKLKPIEPENKRSSVADLADRLAPPVLVKS